MLPMSYCLRHRTRKNVPRKKLFKTQSSRPRRRQRRRRKKTSAMIHWLVVRYLINVIYRHIIDWLLCGWRRRLCLLCVRLETFQLDKQKPMTAGLLPHLIRIKGANREGFLRCPSSLPSFLFLLSSDPFKVSAYSTERTIFLLLNALETEELRLGWREKCVIDTIINRVEAFASWLLFNNQTFARFQQNGEEHRGIDNRTCGYAVWFCGHRFFQHPETGEGSRGK